MKVTPPKFARILRKTSFSARHHASLPKTRRLSSQVLPSTANVVVVGGGIIGSSVAYHLASLGVDDVILLERDRLTSGTTWHAAGLMNSFGSMSTTSTWARRYTQELYTNILPEETGLDTGWKNIGFIELASDVDRLESYRRTAAFNRLCGVDVREIRPEEVKERFPLCDVTGVEAGFYVEADGRANPTDATLALAKGARQKGARIFEQSPVSEVITTKTRWPGTPKVAGVRLSDGREVMANTVVNCAGMWARQFGEANGVTSIPLQAAEHYYLITDEIEGVESSLPVIEDSSKCVYIRPESGGLMLGFFEWEGVGWNAEKIPDSFSFGEIEPDWDRMAPYIEAAIERVPIVASVGIKKLFCGPESFTPDNSPVVGESPELRNYFVAAGLNSLGILTAGGIGHVVAQWIQSSRAPRDIDVTGIHSNRFHPDQSTLAYRSARVGESLGNTYKVHFPDHQAKTCRDLKQSALHERMQKANAVFWEVSGWESPSYFRPDGIIVDDEESFGRTASFDLWKAEHLACRNDAVLFDMSFMSKYLVQGSDAGSFLNRLSTSDVDVAEKITYTQWLNEEGGMEADLTVIKLNDYKFLVVATDTMRTHVLDHMQRRMQPTEHVVVTDATSGYAMISLQGPRSLDIVQRLTSENMSEFEFRCAREIDIDMVRVLCTRITYVGELGFELFVPTESARFVYDCLLKEGADFNLRHAGLQALRSLRLEKGYKDYGHDIDNTDSLLECGLGFTCDFTKSVPFVGQDHVVEQLRRRKISKGLTKRMASVLVTDPEPLMHGGEVLWRNGTRLCDIRVGSYGHSLGGAVGLAMLENEDIITKKFIQSGEWQVEIANSMYPCALSFSPFYDPKGLRLKIT